MVALTGIGGFVNDLFIKDSYEVPANAHRLLRERKVF